jgi:hypothetical protein
MFEQQHKTQKWAKIKRGLVSESPYYTPIDKKKTNKSPKGE